MKKTILKFGIALAVVAAAGYITYSSQTEIQLSGVSIDNVEALASGELPDIGQTIHETPCVYPPYKKAVSCTDGGSEYCSPSDC